MNSFFLVCTLLGGGVLLLQLVLGAIGLDADADADLGGDHLHGGLDLLSIRALSAGVAAFGIGGLIGAATPFGAVAGILLGTLLGLSAAFGVAWAMRAMLRLEADGTLQMENAIGATGTVYLTIPPEKGGMGKVHVTVQGRLVEVAAVTAHAAPLSTGARVVIIDLPDRDVVEVAPEAVILPIEVSHVDR